MFAISQIKYVRVCYSIHSACVLFCPGKVAAVVYFCVVPLIYMCFVFTIFFHLPDESILFELVQYSDVYKGAES